MGLLQRGSCTPIGPSLSPAQTQQLKSQGTFVTKLGSDRVTT